MKRTKNIITRDMCKDELKRYTKSSVTGYAVLLSLLLLVVLPIGVGVGSAIIHKSIIIGILWMILCLLPVCILIPKFISWINLMNLVNQGNFYIVKDTVLRVAIEPKRGSGSSSGHVITFSKNGKYLPFKSPSYLCSVGDEFYLVIIPAKKPKICFAYHTMMYECNDVDDVTM